MKGNAFLLVTLSALALAPVESIGAAPAHKKTFASAPLLSAEAGQAAGLSAQELKDAPKLYTTKCMRCHKSYDPAAYNQSEWESWMVKMRKKAHLGPEQDDLLSRYLTAYRTAGSALRTNTFGAGAKKSGATPH